jgi:hypothetical protein
MITGLSISFCIKDIAAGVVSEDMVEKIIGGTSVKSPEDWEKVIASYRKNYWYKFPDEAEQLFRRMLAAGKIEQCKDQSVHNIARGKWIVNGVQTHDPYLGTEK